MINPFKLIAALGYFLWTCTPWYKGPNPML